MDRLTQLPVECLQYILHVLDNDNDCTTLARILVTSKYIASVTLPILYCDPFRLAFHQTQPSLHSPSSCEMLTLMLLSRLPVASLSKALSLVLVSDPADPFSATTVTTTTSSSLDYLSHIRHLNIRSLSYFEQLGIVLPMKFSIRQFEYILSDEFDQLYQSNPFAPNSPALWSDYKESILQDYYGVIIRLDAYCCLADPILQQLKSFTIPMSLYKRFYDAMGQFENLETVRFLTSKAFENPFGDDNDNDPNDNAARRQRRNELIQEITWFVQGHTELFKGQLKTVHALEGTVWDMVNQEYINRTRFDLYRLLPPLSQPTHIGNDNWLQFLAHPNAVDLEHVQEFASVYLSEPVGNATCITIQSILQRCRSLRKLVASNDRAGMFKWAVQEKRSLELIERGAVIDSVYSDQRAHRIRGLVPLEDIHIGLTSLSSTDDIPHIVFAFNQTLRNLVIRFLDFSPLDLLHPTRVGQDWVDLPALTQLHLTHHLGRLVVDSQLLAHCPNLTILRLADNTLEYLCQDISPILPFRLGRLDKLELVGWPALTFDPATLSSTTILRHMCLQVQSWDYDEFGNPYPREFIPPVEELHRSYSIQGGLSTPTTHAIDSELEVSRPRWTWDWHLPLLTHLHLSSEFAYLFEFKFLHGLPVLIDLRLNIFSTTTGEHTRVISEANLSVPTRDNSSLMPSQPATKRLYLPFLDHLRLDGEWVIDEKTMSQLLVDMCPSLTQLGLKGCTVATLESLVKSFRSIPERYSGGKMKHVDFSEPSSSLDLVRLGIIKLPRDDDGDQVDMDGLLDVPMANCDDSAQYRPLKHLP